MNKESFDIGQNKKTIQLSVLDNQPIILPLRDEHLYWDRFIEHNVYPNVVCKSEGVLHDMLWVKNGIGMAIGTESYLSVIPHENMIFKKIVNLTIQPKSSFIWKKDLYMSPILDSFIEFLHELELKK